MRKLSLFLLCTFIYLGVQAQLSGTKMIPGDYPTLADAVTALNTQGVGAGGVTLQLGANQSLSATLQIGSATLSVGAAASSQANPIIINGGNFTINAAFAGTRAGSLTSGANDASIVVNGTDYITIKNCVFTEQASNNTATLAIENAIAFYNRNATTPFDGVQFATVENCTFNLSKAATVGSAVYSTNCIWTGTASLAWGSFGTAPGDMNREIEVKNNTFTGSYNYVVYRGVSGTNGKALKVTGNTFTNIGGGASTAYGVYALYLDSMIVNNNTFTISASQSAAFYGAFASTSCGGKQEFNGNTVTLGGAITTATSYGGYYTSIGADRQMNNNIINFGTFSAITSAPLYGLYGTYSGGNNNITWEMNGNTISNQTFPPTTGTSYLLYNNGSSGTGRNIVMNNNTITNITRTNSGTLYALYPGTGNNATATGNTITGINWTNNSASGSASFTGIYSFAAPLSQNIHTNTIGNITITGSSTSTSGTLRGIYSATTASGSSDVYNNNIYNLTFGAGTHTGTVTGIYVSTSTPNLIYNNKVYDLNANQAAGLVNGIQLAGATTNDAYNNIIGNLTTPNATGANAVIGINISSSTTTHVFNVHFNTVNINASSTGTNFGSSAISANTGSTVNLINNILVNTSTSTGTGITAAYRRSSATLTTHGNASNNNLFYAGTPGAANLIFTDGTNPKQTISDYKSWVTPRDGASFSENPTYISTVGSNNNYLHINTTVPTQIESGGIAVSGITTDFDGNTRDASTPDVGADEFNGIGTDLTPPTIAITALSTTTICTDPRTVTATITDASDVNTTAGTKPRLWFKKSTDTDALAMTNTSAADGWKWVEATNSTSPFSFTFNYNLLTSPVMEGDSISYFITAQDLQTTPNAGGSIVTFSNPITSVALAANAFPTSGAVRGFRIATQPNPILVKINKTDVCVSGTVTLDLDGISLPGGELQWQSSPLNANTWSDITGGTTAPFTTAAITASTDFRLVVKCGGVAIASSPSNTVSLTVNNPAIVSSTPGTRCGVGTVDLTAVGDGGATVKWYAAASGGTALATGDNFTTPSISATTTYYAAATLGGGTASVGPLSPSIGTSSGSTIAVTTQYTNFNVLSAATLTSVTVYPTAAIGSTFNISIRNSAGTELYNSGSILTTVTGGSTPQLVTLNAPLVPGTAYRIGLGVNPGMTRNTTGASHPYEIPGVLSITGNSFDPVYWYFLYDWKITSGCEGTRVPVVATVTSPDALTSLGHKTICNNAIDSLAVTSAPTNYNTYIWSPTTSLFTDAACTVPYTGGNAIKVYVKTNTAGKTGYKVIATNTTSQCVNEIIDTITVMPAPSLVAAPPSLCVTGTSNLSLNPAAGYGLGTIQWQNSPNGMSYTDIPSATNPVYTTPTLTTTTYYQVIIKDGAGNTCGSPLTQTITVNNPLLLTTTGASRCGTGTVTLNATTTPGNNVAWFAANTGGVPLGTGNNFVTPIISGTTDFYAASFAPLPGSIITQGLGATTTATYSNPFYSLYSNNHTQHLITAAELVQSGLIAGPINSLGLDVTSAGSLPMIDLSVKIGTTAATSMTAFVSDPLTTVYTNASLLPTTGINMLTFSSPFVWDGVSNIVLEFCHGNGASTATMSRTVKADNTSYVSSIKTHRTASPGTDASTICGDVTTNVATYSLRPQFIFNGVGKCEGPRTLVTATVATAPVLTTVANDTICNNSSKLLNVTSTVGDFDNYVWAPTTGLFTDAAGTTAYTGGNASSVYVKTATAGTTQYVVTGTNSTGAQCANTDTIMVRVMPNPTITASPEEICVSGTSNLTLSATTGYAANSLQWQTSPDGMSYSNISNATNANYTTPTITSTTYYKMVIKDASGATCSTAPTKTIAVNSPTITGTTPGTRCGTGTVNLSATASGGASVKWYAAASGGTALFTGGTFTTPSISTTTTYYTAASQGGGSATVGAPNNGQNTGYTLEAGLFFDVTTPLTINGVYVYPVGTGTGDVVISLLNASLATVATTTVNLTGTTAPGIKTYVNLNFVVPIGTGYSLNMMSRSGGVASLVRDASGSITGGGFPFTVPGVISITGGRCCPSAASTSYYYFYDWQIATGCESTTRTAVTATIDNSMGCVPFPVNLLSFKGEKNGNINALEWKTATELNNAGFELQRSADGNTFSAVTFIASKAVNGNSTGVLTYQFDDIKPINGNNYYRLKQIDKDGKATYSNIVLIRGNRMNQLVVSNLYPNPTKKDATLILNSPAADKVSIVITDVTGRVVFQKAASLITGDNLIQLPISQLGSGTYLVKCLCSNGCETAVKKLIKE
jgi:hypothetical protein